MSLERTFPVEYSDLHVRVLDQPTPSGTHNEYAIMHGETEIARVSFQNGTFRDNGVNGVTNEALLLVVAHRLRSFQAGPFVCDENRQALEHIEKAVQALFQRTKERRARGVEGTHQL